jgi:hypothetical protein
MGSRITGYPVTAFMGGTLELPSTLMTHERDPHVPIFFPDKEDSPA